MSFEKSNDLILKIKHVLKESNAEILEIKNAVEKSNALSFGNQILAIGRLWKFPVFI